MSQVIENVTTPVTIDDKFNTDNVRQFVDATRAVGGNFQAFITESIEANRVDCLLDYVHELLAEYGRGSEMNEALSCIRPPLARACVKLDMDKMTIKWDKNTEKYVFVASKKQAVVEPEAEPANDNDGGNDEGATDQLMSEASRLMATFMQSRSIDDASKVTEFMLSIAK
jgi:hypothetical protein